MFSKAELQQGHFHRALDSSKFLQMNVARDASGNAEYVGWSAPGTPEDETGWLIMKHFYTANDLDKSRIADTSLVFDKVWDSRAGYNY